MIRFKHIKNIILSGLVAASLVSCDKSLETINENPNRALDAPLDAVFNGSMVAIIQANEGENARLACMWSRQFTGTDRQYSAFNSYTITAEDFDWAGFYYAAVNLNIAIEKADAEGNGFYSGVSKIVKAHQYGTLTSLWGDAPYSQSVDLLNYPAPQFDPQSDIYTAVQAMLDEGINDLTTGVGTGSDIFFNGDRAAWLKVAHSLKARFYLHVGDYSSALTEATQGVDTTAGNWMIPHGDIYNQDLNLWNSFGTQDRQGYLTAPGAYLPTIMDTTPANIGKRNHAKTNENKRFADWYINNGGAADDYDLNYSGSLWSGSSSYPLLTVHENLLIQAECEYRAGNLANALARLNDVRSIIATQYPEGTYDAFDLADFDPGTGIEDNGKGSQADNLFYEILEEKYASLIGQSEVFCDVRRTNNFLEITPVTGSDLPERFLIPQDELDGNSNAPSPIPGIFIPTPVNQ